MILAALSHHYDLQAARGRLPAFGLTQEKVSFALVLGRNGELLDIEDIRDTTGKKPKWTLLAVPASFKRSGPVQSGSVQSERIWRSSLATFSAS